MSWQRDPLPDENGILHKDYAYTITDGCNLAEQIPERYRDARLEHLPSAIRRAAESLPGDRGLFLWGPPGVGKTYGMAAIAYELYHDGWEVQFNVVDVETLRAAQQSPEEYKDLVVRVVGYSAFFVDLDGAVQEDIINRTEHGI